MGDALGEGRVLLAEGCADFMDGGALLLCELAEQLEIEFLISRDADEAVLGVEAVEFG
jgi:hypothetical protein